MTTPRVTSMEWMRRSVCMAGPFREAGGRAQTLASLAGFSIAVTAYVMGSNLFNQSSI
jgi:hypothetical protein